MIDQAATIRPVSDADREMISKLHADVFGPGRFARSAYRVREGTPYAGRYCRLVTKAGRLVAALRMTAVTIGGTPGALLLGPLAVDPGFANQGYGRGLVADSFAAATTDGYRLVVLVGDLSYYARMGFVAVPRGQIWLPGPADPGRILGRELAPGSVGEFKGLITADLSAKSLG